MRLYGKIILMIAAFTGLVSATGQRMTRNLAYEVRVGFVCWFGNDADYERLLEYTDRMLDARRSADAAWAHEQFLQLDASGEERTGAARGRSCHANNTKVPARATGPGI